MAEPEFTDTARAALLWVLWHHQGGSSKVGQPLRFALGMGAHDRLSDSQVEEARRWGELHALGQAAAGQAERAVVDAAREWWCERVPKDWCEADLAKAVIRLEGDWPGCPGCDHQCDEPCVPATAEEQIRGVDFHIAQLVHEGKLARPLEWKPPEGWAPRPKQAARPEPHHTHGMQPGETPAQAAERWAQWCERRCLSMLPEFLRHLAGLVPAPRQPDYWGFVHDDECRIEMSFSPSAPAADGRSAVPIWIGAQPAAEPVAHVEIGSTGSIRWRKGLTVADLVDGAPLYTHPHPGAARGGA